MKFFSFCGLSTIRPHPVYYSSFRVVITLLASKAIVLLDVHGLPRVADPYITDGASSSVA